MALTHDFRETTMKRAKRDSKFRRGLLTDGVRLLLTGEAEDLAVGKSLIRDYINATIGFQTLAEQTGKKPESLMRMFGTNGNPRLSNFSQILHLLQESEGIQLTVKAAK